jgi:hypothetical protein
MPGPKSLNSDALVPARGLPVRRGGVRKDRCFRVYLEVPDGVSEDAVMDLIEEAVASHANNLRIDPNTITVKRHTKKYAEEG